MDFNKNPIFMEFIRDNTESVHSYQANLTAILDMDVGPKNFAWKQINENLRDLLYNISLPYSSPIQLDYWVSSGFSWFMESLSDWA